MENRGIVQWFLMMNGGISMVGPSFQATTTGGSMQPNNLTLAEAHTRIYIFVPWLGASSKAPPVQYL